MVYSPVLSLKAASLYAESSELSVLSKAGTRPPLSLLEVSVDFDYLRKERVLAILTRLARHNQVLYFTADHRARQLTGVIDLERLDSE